MHCIFYAFILSSRQKIGTTNSKKLLYTMAVFFQFTKRVNIRQRRKITEDRGKE